MNWRAKIHSKASGPQPFGTVSSVRPGAARSSAPHRHPTMSGLDVSPVHGRHCICHGCERSTHRDAA